MIKWDFPICISPQAFGRAAPVTGERRPYPINSTVGGSRNTTVVRRGNSPNLPEACSAENKVRGQPAMFEFYKIDLSGLCGSTAGIGRPRSVADSTPETQWSQRSQFTRFPARSDRDRPTS